MKKIDIPDTWSGEEAKIVYEFLGDLIDAVFNAYEDTMVPIWITEMENDEHHRAQLKQACEDDIDDSDIPF